MTNQVTPQLEEHIIKSWWLPLLAGLSLCTLILGTWRTLELQEAVDVGSRVESDLKNRIPALQRTGSRKTAGTASPARRVRPEAGYRPG